MFVMNVYPFILVIKKTKTNAYLYFCVCCSYHLQALRHLAVLAAEPRLLVPVDVDSLKPCYALLEVTYKVRLQETCTNLIPVNDHQVHVSKLNIVFPVPKPPLKPPLILCHSSLSQTAPLCSVLHFYINTKANVRSDSDCRVQCTMVSVRFEVLEKLACPLYHCVLLFLSVLTALSQSTSSTVDFIHFQTKSSSCQCKISYRGLISFILVLF